MKITCDVIKDLAELYVDDVLSDDSNILKIAQNAKNI